MGSGNTDNEKKRQSAIKLSMVLMCTGLISMTLALCFVGASILYMAVSGRSEMGEAFMGIGMLFALVGFMSGNIAKLIYDKNRG